jgi:hypothetical protein
MHVHYVFLWSGTAMRVQRDDSTSGTQLSQKRKAIGDPFPPNYSPIRDFEVRVRRRDAIFLSI